MYSGQVGKATLLYERLSHDDELQGLSNSIVNQRDLLQEYAERNGFKPYVHITDDGYSGTGWDRPGWLKLLDEVDSGNVSTLIFKDLSRMGRDYLRVGLYMEMFSERGVRLIAINDGIDTAKGEDDFTPFRAIMAEWYARDTSRKIKSVFHKKGRDGKPMCTTPIYGFRKAPDEKDVWLIDDEAATIVRRIFQMTVDGMGPFVIAKTLMDEKIERPSYYLYRAGIQKTGGKCNLDLPYNWRGNVISKLLLQREYMGDLVNFKYYKPSFKSTKIVRNAPEDHAVFEDALPAIVSRETWELAQKLRKTRRVRKQILPPNPLSGLVFCSDCGGKMSNRRKTIGADSHSKNPPNYDTYECATYRNSYKRQINKCSLHYVTSEAIRKAIFDTIRRVIIYANENEAEFADKIREAAAICREETAAAHRAEMQNNERRIGELDILFRKTYEDNAIGKLSDERYAQLSNLYDREQAELKASNAKLQAELDIFAENSEKTDCFIELARRYTEACELTTPMLNEFVDKVFVHEADKSSGERVQKIDVYLRFIGNFDVPAVAEECSLGDIEAEARRLARKRKQREYARRRYANMKVERELSVDAGAGAAL